MRRSSALAIILAAGLSVTGAAYWGARELDERRFRAQFVAGAERVTRDISRQIEGDLSALAALRAFMELRQPTGLADFDGYAKRLLEAHPSLLAAEWIEHVTPATRPQFEKGLLADYGVTGGITDRGPGKGIAAAAKAAYFPVRYLYPRSEANRAALGYDFGSCTPCLRALDMARTTGKPASMERLRVLEGTRDGYAIPLILAAGQKAEGVSARYAMIMLQVGAVVERALGGNSVRSDLEFYDVPASGEKRFLYYHGTRPKPRGVAAPPEPASAEMSRFQLTQQIPVGDHTWQIVTVPTPEEVAAGSSERPWVVLGTGLLITVIALAFTRSRGDIEDLRKDAAGVREVNRRLEDLAGERGRKLADSEARLMMALDTVSDGFWEWDVASGEVYYSPQWIRLLGYKPEAVSNRVEFFFSIIHPDDLAALQRANDDHLEGRTQIKEIDVRLRTATGQYLIVHDRGIVVDRDSGGKALRMVGTITDITRRRQAEDKLRDDMRLSDFSGTIGTCLTRSQPLEAALQGCCEAIVGSLRAASARIWILDREKSVLHFRAGAGIHARSEYAPSPPPLGSMGVGVLVQQGRPHLTNRLAEDIWVGEARFAAQHGLQAYGAYPLRVEGQTVGLLDVFGAQAFSDETFQTLANAAASIALSIERAEAQTALRENEDRMRAVLDLATGASIGLDSAGGIVSWSSDAVSLFGWLEAQVEGKAFAATVLQYSSRSLFEQGFKEHLLNRVLRVNAQGRDESVFEADLAVIPVADRGGTAFMLFVQRR